MSGPIPVRPQEPRWWVSVNGQVEGPYGEAYIIACLNAGQIPGFALLCLEGATQWQPLSAWPQFMVASPPPPPPQPFSFVHTESAPRISSTTSSALPDRVKTAITYARFWSPMVWGLTLVWTLSAATDMENFLALLVFLVVESAGRGFMLLGANQVGDNSRSGATTMKVGSWILTASLSLRILLILAGILFILSLEPASNEMAFQEPEPVDDVVSGLLVLAVMLAVVVEFGYSFFFRAAASHVQRMRR